MTENGTAPNIRAAEIRELYLAGCSAVTFWRLRRSDTTFPKPFLLGKTQYWHREDVHEWYESSRHRNEVPDLNHEGIGAMS